MVLIFANIFLTLVNRSFYYSIWTTLKYKNKLVPLIIGITLLLAACLLFIPPFTAFFEFETLTVGQLGISILAGLVSVLWYELVKLGKAVSYRSMGQFIPQQSINESTQERTTDDHKDGIIAGPGKHVHRPGTSPCQRPAQSEDGTPYKISGNTLIFGIQLHWLIADGFQVVPFDNLNADDSQHQRGTDDAIHMEGAELEHLIDTEPRGGFRFIHHDSKKDSYC
jgi:hypothetical protein